MLYKFQLKIFYAIGFAFNILKLDFMFILNKILFRRFIFSLEMNIRTYQRTLENQK